MKLLTPNETTARDAREQLENAIMTSAALLEALAELMMKGLTGDCLTLSAETIRGLHLLAEEQGQHLRGRFNELVAATRAKA
ncbi:MAG: hypothetical protein H0X40_03015 [Chthoniobacterales bacterium]|nr:hypothetical protein [Chthoniobacterales bacterium]